jgi:hypothetical protein
MCPASTRVLSTAATALLLAACSGTAPAGPPAPAWIHTLEGDQFSRALDVSCNTTTAADAGTADAGAEECVGLVRYRTRIAGLPDAGEVGNDRYGNVLISRFTPAGATLWQQTLLWGSSGDYAMNGTFVDDDLRASLLPNAEFLVSGTYTGRVLVGVHGGDSSHTQDFGYQDQRATLFYVEFHADGSFDNWDDIHNDDRDQHALVARLMPDSSIVVGGSCQGLFQLDDEHTFDCGPTTSGYLLTTLYDGTNVGAVAFHDSPAAEVTDVLPDDSGNLLVSGTFEQVMTFATSTPVGGVGDGEGFLMKLGPDRKPAWTVLATSLGHDRGGRIARGKGGTLWTALVQAGARVGVVPFTQDAQVVALVDDDGKVLWARTVDAPLTSPLRVASAPDGSYALYGDDFLGRYGAAGDELWVRRGADVRGAAFTGRSLVVAGTAIGTHAFGASLAASGDLTPRAFYAAFPR